MFLRKKRRYASELDRIGLSIMDICSGVFAVGTIGSGKTSVLAVLLKSVLNFTDEATTSSQAKRVTCLWCCVKGDEADHAEEVIKSTVMADSLMRLVPGHFTFNFVAAELTREGGSPASLTRLLERLNTMLKNSSQGGSNEDFWKSLFFDYMHYAIWIAWLAHRDKITVEHIHDVIATSPTSPEDAGSANFYASPCWQMLKLADKNISSEAEDRALYKAGEFFLAKQVVLGEAARGAGIQQCSSVLSPFLIAPLYETVCAEKSSFQVDMVLNDHCVILDFPILVHQQGGMLFQSLVTMMVQEAALRRRHPDTICVIVRDEFQYLAADMEFESMVQSVCRSHLLAHISASQNIPLLQAASGGDQRGETLTRALLANYRTKLILANICDTTNRLFSEMFGQFKDQFLSLNESNAEPDDFMGKVFGAKPFSLSMSEHLHHRLPPEKFLTLRRGGPQFNFLIDAYLTIGGHQFDNGLPFKRVTFSQR